MTRDTATLLGFVAILLWALLALLTDLTGSVPPFQLLAMCFAIGGGAGLLTMRLARRPFSQLKQPPKVWILGVGGLFGYHFLYFTALRAAPAAEASLIAYLWPLLIVLLSTFVTGERTRASHVIGAVTGFLGAALLVGGPTGFAPNPAFIDGYLIAFAAAFVWSGYSVLSRTVADVPTDAVTGFCLATAVGSTVMHLALETTVWPESALAWAAVLGLGLGPVGLAFFVWDVGVKKGDLPLLGVASYSAPLLSTLVLVLAGRAQATWTLALACGLITAGAAIAASSTFRQTRPGPS